MKTRTRRTIVGWLGSRLDLLAMLTLVLAALIGQPLEASAGLVAYPPRVIGVPDPLGGRKRDRKRAGEKNSQGLFIRTGGEYLTRTWQPALMQSAFLCAVWELSGELLPAMVLTLPCAKWLLAAILAACPRLGHEPEVRFVCWVIERLRWASLMLLIAGAVWQRCGQDVFDNIVADSACLIVPMGLVSSGDKAVKEGSGPVLEVDTIKGGYKVRLLGEFTVTVKKNDPFRLRLIIMFLRQLEGPIQRQGSRATRDGRRPLISQQRLATLFGISQPEISRWEKWWLARDWANLLSLRSAEVLTVQLRARIVDVMARFPWWGHKQVYDHLKAQGVDVTHTQVRQAAEESGWVRLRATLKQFFVIGSQSIRPRDEALVHELVGQVKMLLAKVEAGEGLTREECMEVADLQTMCDEADLTPLPEAPGVPWARKIKWILFASGVTVDKGGEARCTYCGSTKVRIKSRKGRVKRYLDEAGQWQTVKVYRYRCLNPECSYGSFTHMPLGLLPHSPYPLQMRLQALEMYAWGRSTYRRTAQALGVRAGRVYCWISAFGGELLPVAALFGVVRSSGVIGVDEKWVQVPEKAPRGSGKSKQPKPHRWMYVYLAIDVYTYDLLHIAIYAHNTANSTRSFLLALRAKGYKPRVIVTDLRQEYGPAIAEIFPKACHHECIFHALQWVHRQFKDVYGKKYAEFCPEAVKLKEKIDGIFQAKTRRTAEKRYAQVMSLRQQYVNQKPEVASIFATLQRHWPTLVNGIESTIIPRTNNAVERVIGRFDQHYQNFRGFDSIESARLYLGVFEKVYRFTPFTEDAQPRIRGKCPLELAGYDISELPMTQVCSGWALDWPLDYAKEAVPNV